MDLTTLFSKRIETASQTIGAINCFSEYVASKFNDLANFMSGIGNYASVYINEANDSLTQKLVLASQQDYAKAVEEPDADITLRCRDSISAGSTITIKGQDLSDAFDEQLSNLRCQEQFISYCLSVASTSVSDFMTRVKTVAPTLSGAIIDKFSRLIEISGSPLECLKNFFSQYSDDSVTYTDQYITLVNPEDYIGNVWEAAWTQVVDTITGFFEGAWQGIKDLAGFFKRVLGGILELGKWIVSHAFHELTTVYEKGCDASIGIMDVPIFQVYGSTQDLQNFLSTMYTANYQYSYSWDGWNHVINYSMMNAHLLESIANLIIDKFDGVTYKSVCEVIIPSKPCDIALRIGRLHNDNFCMSAYIVSDYGSWSQFEDYDNNNRIYDSFMQALEYVSTVIPMVKGKQHVDDTSTKWHEITDLFFDYNHLNDREYVRLLKVSPIALNQAQSSQQLSRVFMSLLIYACLMSKGFLHDGEDATNTVLESYLFSPTRNLYSVDPDDRMIINSYEDTPFDLDEFNSGTFRPYSKRNQLSVSIHYQTIQEQAKEILSTILKVIVAVVAVVATIKFVKWSKKRKKDTILAHANVDKLSWDVAANPSSENIAAFNKAYRKSRKMDFVNGILGLSSGSNDSSTSLIGTISSIIGKGTKESTAAATSASQASSDIANVSSTVDDIKVLIKGS